MEKHLTHLSYALWLLAGICLAGLGWLSLLTGATTPASPPENWPKHLVLGIGLLVVALGMVVTYIARKRHANPTDDGSTEDTLVAILKPAELDAPEDKDAESLVGKAPYPSNLDQYLIQFRARYGEFYRFLQDIPIQPDEAQKQQIRRWLVEMGLHAHSLARAHKFDPTLNSVAEEPNVTLVLTDQQIETLPPSAYRTFSDDPHVFDRRYQFLRQVLQDMNLGTLDGALAQKMYYTPTYLTPTEPQ
jgi:hypothetical protein